MSDNAAPVEVDKNVPARTPGCYGGMKCLCLPTFFLCMRSTSDPNVLVGQGCLICQVLPLWHIKWELDPADPNSYTETCCFGCSTGKAIRASGDTFAEENGENPIFKVC